MKKFKVILGLLLLGSLGPSSAMAEHFEESQVLAVSNESLAFVGLQGRCLAGGVNELTINYGGTAATFEISYNGQVLARRNSPGTFIFRPGTRLSRISVKGCVNSNCDTDTQTWDGRDCSRPGNPDPRPGPGPVPL